MVALEAVSSRAFSRSLSLCLPLSPLLSIYISLSRFLSLSFSFSPEVKVKVNVNVNVNVDQARPVGADPASCAPSPRPVRPCLSARLDAAPAPPHRISPGFRVRGSAFDVQGFRVWG